MPDRILMLPNSNSNNNNNNNNNRIHSCSMRGIDVQVMHFNCHVCVQFQVHASEYYPYLCDIVLCDLKSELRSIVRKFFLRTGTAFCITTAPAS